MIDTFISLGYLGMLISAFVAGSFFPMSSEAVLLGLQALGLDPILLLLYASIGNVAGSMFNFCVGRMGNLEWITKYLHVSEESLQRAERFMEGKGAWIGILAWIPILGSGITIMLGYMRANVLVSVLSISIGKVLRYVILIYGVILAQMLF